MELTEGTLYQVYYNKDWRIAEFSKTLEPTTYKYHTMDMMKLKISDKEYTRTDPKRHVFFTIAPYGRGSCFWIPAKGAQIRTVGEESRNEVARLKEDCAAAQKAEAAARKALREFCG